MTKYKYSVSRLAEFQEFWEMVQKTPIKIPGQLIDRQELKWEMVRDFEKQGIQIQKDVEFDKMLDEGQAGLKKFCAQLKGYQSCAKSNKNERARLRYKVDKLMIIACGQQDQQIHFLFRKIDDLILVGCHD